MNKKPMSIMLALAFPALFFYLQVSGLSIFRLTDNHSRIECVGLKELALTVNCSCPAINTPHYGFPVRSTGYGQCGLYDDATAQNINIAIGVVAELTLVIVLIGQRRKKSQI